MSHGHRKAFTLLELLIVVVILGVLAAIIIPRVTANAAEAKKVACSQNVGLINGMVEKWYVDKGKWPLDSLEDIGADPAYFPKGIPKCPVTGAKYMLNSVTHRVSHLHVSAEAQGFIERLIAPILH